MSLHSWEHEIGDVLLITRKGVEVVARVADYADSLDNTTPIYCNLRNVDNAYWRRSIVKVEPSQIIKALPTWEENHKKEVEARHKADIKAYVDEVWPTMTDADKRRIHREAIELGIAQPDNRSPLDIMIDRACGIE